MCGEEDWGDVALSGESCVVVKRGEWGKEICLKGFVAALPSLCWTMARMNIW